jgi:membrane protein DedA with SNARE-associated domain
MTHGYSALFIWSILEGEIGLILAGWLSSQHLVFDYRYVILTAIGGAAIGDMIPFLTGKLFKKTANKWLNRYPEKKEKIKKWIKKWGPLVIIFERFVYGTHIPVLLTFGLLDYRFSKFLFFDIIGIILWSFTFVSIGYYFGQNTVYLILLIQKNIVIWFFIFLILYVFFKTKNSN